MSMVWLDGFPLDLEKLPIEIQWDQGFPRSALEGSTPVERRRPISIMRVPPVQCIHLV
ncbi:MAG: hypothetical protein JW753_05280 [Dehalococcoidia bacterium]|nr:hypothetical protein [Dehalococcoidia bacterium]